MGLTAWPFHGARTQSSAQQLGAAAPDISSRYRRHLFLVRPSRPTAVALADPYSWQGASWRSAGTRDVGHLSSVTRLLPCDRRPTPTSEDAVQATGLLPSDLWGTKLSGKEVPRRLGQAVDEGQALPGIGKRKRRASACPSSARGVKPRVLGTHDDVVLVNNIDQHWEPLVQIALSVGDGVANPQPRVQTGHRIAGVYPHTAHALPAPGLPGPSARRVHEQVARHQSSRLRGVGGREKFDLRYNLVDLGGRRCGT